METNPGAYIPPPCTHRCKRVGEYCTAPATYLVITQIPPYTTQYTCEAHLACCINDLLGTEKVPVIVRRVTELEVW